MDLHISVLLNDVSIENVVMLIEIGGGIFFSVCICLVLRLVYWWSSFHADQEKRRFAAF